MTRLLLATGNPGKLRDFRGIEAALPDLRVELLTDFAHLPSVEETGETFEANARLKAEHYSQFAAEMLAADDSGLIVDALEGEPGVRSARYAGRHGDDAANNRLVLDRMRGMPEERRTARFACCLAIARAGQTLATFFGTVEGVIVETPRGSGGFGYDPLFYCPAAGCTLAELSAEEKAHFSHRGAAARQLLTWLQNQNP